MTHHSPRPPSRFALIISFSIVTGLSLVIALMLYRGKTRETNTNNLSPQPQAVKSQSDAGGIVVTAFITGLGFTLLWGIDHYKQGKKQQALEDSLEKLQNQLNEQISLCHFARQQAEKTAKSVESAKVSFLSHINDRLYNPLHIILGYTQLIQKSLPPTAQTQDYLEAIKRNAEILSSLVDNLLEMSYLEAGKIGFNPSRFNLRRFLELIKAQLEPLAISKGLYLKFSLPEDCPLWIIADEKKLRQVVVNLLENGIKFTDAGGVTLRIAISDEAWIMETEEDLSEQPVSNFLFLAIEDSGCGISPEFLDNIFSPFALIPEQNKKKEGIGLGLTISHKLVALMGGRIVINSENRQGTSVRLSIPINFEDEESHDNFMPWKRVFGLAPNQPDYRILVVDDKEDNRLLLINLLKPLGFEIEEATNGKEAIELWSSWHPHLIWMDTKMPDMNGYEVVDQIRQLELNQNEDPLSPAFKSIIIALISGILEEEKARLFALGCDDVVHKPIQVEMLLEKMTEYLKVRYTYAPEDHIDFLQYPITSTLDQVNLFQPDNVYFSLEPDALQVLSPQWKMSVDQAASAGDSRAIYQLIAEITDKFPILSSQLMILLNQYNFRKIKQLIQEGEQP